MRISSKLPLHTQPNIYILPGDLRNVTDCQWHVNQREENAARTRTGAQQGLGLSLRVPHPPPRPARVPGTDLGRGKRWRGGVTCLRDSRLLPASRSRPGHTAAVSRVRGGDAHRVWLRDSRGGGPGSPRREEMRCPLDSRGGALGWVSTPSTVLYQTGDWTMIKK